MTTNTASNETKDESKNVSIPSSNSKSADSDIKLTKESDDNSKIEEKQPTPISTANPISSIPIPTPQAMVMGLTAPLMPPYPGFPVFGALPPPPTEMLLNSLNMPLGINLTPATKPEKRRIGDWEEFKTPEGKAYYHNYVLNKTQWDKPKEFEEGEKAELENEAKRKASEEKNSENYLGTNITKNLVTVSDKVSARKFGESKSNFNTMNKENRIEIFYELLKDKNIEPNYDWRKVLPLIVNDKRYNALKSLKEKKNHLKIWQQKESERIEKEKKEKKDKLRSDYVNLLNENLEEIVLKSFRKSKHLLENDERFNKINDKHKQKYWFEEWQKIEKKKFEKREKELKEKYMNEFEKLLKTISDKINIYDSWKNFEKKYYNKKRKKTNNDENEDNINCNNNELFNLFSEIHFDKHVCKKTKHKIYDIIKKELIKKKEESLLIEKNKRRLLHREERKEFRNLLQECIDKNILNTKCKWNFFKELNVIKNDIRYKNLEKNQSNKIESIFDSFIDSIKKEIRNDKKIFKNYIKTHNNNELIKINIIDYYDSVYERFKKLIETSANSELVKNISEKNFKLLLSQYIEKEKSNIISDNIIKPKCFEKIDEKEIELFKDIILKNNIKIVYDLIEFEKTNVNEYKIFIEKLNNNERIEILLYLNRMNNPRKRRRKDNFDEPKRKKMKLMNKIEEKEEGECSEHSEFEDDKLKNDTDIGENNENLNTNNNVNGNVDVNKDELNNNESDFYSSQENSDDTSSDDSSYNKSERKKIKSKNKTKNSYKKGSRKNVYNGNGSNYSISNKPDGQNDPNGSIGLMDVNGKRNMDIDVNRYDTPENFDDDEILDYGNLTHSTEKTNAMSRWNMD